MTAIELLKALRQGFLMLLVWNFILSGIIIFDKVSENQESLNEQICNLEAIPQYELVEVK